MLPAPTAWPFALAIGTALGFAGLLTSVSVSVFGAIVAVLGAVGWFREVLPHEREDGEPQRGQERGGGGGLPDGRAAL